MENHYYNKINDTYSIFVHILEVTHLIGFIVDI